MRKLSPNLSLGEMTKTSKERFREENSRPPEALIQSSGIPLCNLLEDVRANWGKPIDIHSAYRCPALNQATKGSSPTSQHVKFEAADFHIVGVDLTEVWNWIWRESGLKFGQVILERNKGASKPSWIHLSLGAPWRDPKRCQQAWTFDGTKYHRIA